jgi:hypothetical protein
MAKSDATVQELVDQIDRGEIRLPEMQRSYVWRAKQVRDLFDSLYRGWPSGAILLWESDEDVHEQQLAVPQSRAPQGSTKLLLDGQQRLTSLSAVIRGVPIEVRGRKKPIELLFNIDHPDTRGTAFEEVVDDDDVETEDEPLEIDGVEVTDATEDEILTKMREMTFIIKVNWISKLPNWISVSDVFKSDDNTKFLQAAGVTSFNDPRFGPYNTRLNRLRDIKKYVYRLDTLERSLSYDEVTEIFVRVNSLGSKLRSSDLALAQITAKWRGSLKILQDFEKKSAQSGLKLDLGSHVRGMVVMATGQSRFRTVSSIGLEDLKVAWAASEKGTNFAVNFLKANCSIPSLALMSSPFLVQALAYFGHVHNFELTNDESTQLRKWALLANAKGRYSRGSSETLLDQDLSTIKNGGTAVDLLNRLAGQVGRLDVIEDDLAGRNQRSSLFKTLFMAMAEDGAVDWKTGIKLKIDHSGAQDRIQFHHIFPKDLLKAKYSTAEIDDIANLAFISGKTNRQILNDFPAKYIPKLAQDFGAERFDHHLLPTLVPKELDIDAYPEFLRARRVLLASRLNSFLGTTAQ